MMTPLGDQLAASYSSSKVRVFDSSSLVDVSRVPAVAVAHMHPTALARVSVEVLAQLSAPAKACLAPEIVARLPRESCDGVVREIAHAAVENTHLYQRRWLRLLPLGALHAAAGEP